MIHFWRIWILEARQYKCNCYNQLSNINVNQLTIRSFVLEKKKKIKKMDLCHFTNNQRFRIISAKFSLSSVTPQKTSKILQFFLQKKNINTRVNVNDLLIFFSELLFLKFLEMHPSDSQNYCLIRLFLWKCTFPKYCIKISKKKDK